MEQNQFNNESSQEIQVIPLENIVIKKIKDKNGEENLNVFANGNLISSFRIANFEDVLRVTQEFDSQKLLDVLQFLGYMRKGKLDDVPEDFPVNLIIDGMFSAFIAIWTYFYTNDFKLECKKV